MNGSTIATLSFTMSSHVSFTRAIWKKASLMVCRKKNARSFALSLLMRQESDVAIRYVQRTADDSVFRQRSAAKVTSLQHHRDKRCPGVKFHAARCWPGWPLHP